MGARRNTAWSRSRSPRRDYGGCLTAHVDGWLSGPRFTPDNRSSCLRVNRPRSSRSDDSVDPVTDADSADTASLERLETRLVGIGPPDNGPHPLSRPHRRLPLVVPAPVQLDARGGYHAPGHRRRRRVGADDTTVTDRSMLAVRFRAGRPSLGGGPSRSFPRRFSSRRAARIRRSAGGTGPRTPPRASRRRGRPSVGGEPYPTDRRPQELPPES